MPPQRSLGMAERVSTFGATIFGEITTLARAKNAVNLGQGAPDFDGPSEVIAAAVQALNNNLNQYVQGIGLPQPREAVARHAKRFHGQEVDPASQVMITAGATEAMFAAILGLTDPGDEVIVFVPTYDSYAANLIMAGVSTRRVYLDPPTWQFDPDALRAAFLPKNGVSPRAIIINTPHNPTGKMFSHDELTLIAELCQTHNVIAITDEVYEHILYDSNRHIRLATLPGMAERTLTISSLGKTFSVTGWKIGWAIGAPDLIMGMNRAHQFITYCVASPLQMAAATALDLPDSYFTGLQQSYQQKRDYLLAALREAGFAVQVPAGGYFIIADWTPLAPAGVEDDFGFAQWLINNVGVACIPPSAFYTEADKGQVRHLARFAVCKREETLVAAVSKLQAWAK
jgi:N-succinyldiaminopimelate aminotransferase